MHSAMIYLLRLKKSRVHACMWIPNKSEEIAVQQKKREEKKKKREEKNRTEQLTGPSNPFPSSLTSDPRDPFDPGSSEWIT